MDKRKEEAVPLAERKKHDKKISGDEAEIAHLQQAMAQAKMRSTLFVSITYIVVYNLLSSRWATHSAAAPLVFLCLAFFFFSCFLEPCIGRRCASGEGG